jgi:hypothetical protein
MALQFWLKPPPFGDRRSQSCLSANQHKWLPQGLFCFRSVANVFAKAQETNLQQAQSNRAFILGESRLPALAKAAPKKQKTLRLILIAAFY